MQDQESPKPTHVVIIDDDPAIRRIVSRYVKDIIGTVATEFESPSDAMDFAARNPDVGIILIDWHIGSINGLEWLEPLNREWPGAVFIVMSADTDPRGFVEVSKRCRVALWWRKTDSIPMLGSLLTVAMEEHQRRLKGESTKTLADVKDEVIREALALHGGNIELAAKALGISTSTIRRHILE
jgi:DNA-binding NtrC family response regulator